MAIVRGAGAFVCGEETGMIASIEGDIGSPRQRPPYPAQSGLWGKPTNINNVETWANVPVIVERGAGWYASIGTERSKGTKVFSLVGKVQNTGPVPDGRHRPGSPAVAAYVPSREGGWRAVRPTCVRNRRWMKRKKGGHRDPPLHQLTSFFVGTPAGLLSEDRGNSRMARNQGTTSINNALELPLVN